MGSVVVHMKKTNTTHWCNSAYMPKVVTIFLCHKISVITGGFAPPVTFSKSYCLSPSTLLVESQSPQHHNYRNLLSKQKLFYC